MMTAALSAMSSQVNRVLGVDSDSEETVGPGEVRVELEEVVEDLKVADVRFTPLLSTKRTSYRELQENYLHVQ
jgi:hypothetical protein